MSSSDTSKIEDVEGLVSALRLSVEHVIQLITVQSQSTDQSADLTRAIERAIAAHSNIVASLESALGKQAAPKQTVHPDKPLDNPKKPIQSDWIEAPWKYLNIPTKNKGRLGPMPRFVPVPASQKLGDK